MTDRDVSALSVLPPPTAEAAAVTLTARKALERMVWRVRLGTLAGGVSVSAMATMAPDWLTVYFPAIGPTSAFIGLASTVILAVMLGWPIACAQIITIARTRETAHSTGAKEVGRPHWQWRWGWRVGAEMAVLAAIVAPGMVVTWKHAPHGPEALLAIGLLIGAVMTAATTWGVADAVWGHALRRWWLAGMTAALFATPLIGFALLEYGDRQPWWLTMANPIWLIADNAPPRPSISGSPYFAPTVAGWIALAVMGAVVAGIGIRRWTFTAIAFAVFIATSAAFITALGGAWGLDFSSPSARMPAAPPPPTATPPSTTTPIATEGVQLLAPAWNYRDFGGDGVYLPGRVALQAGAIPFRGHLLIHAGSVSIRHPAPIVAAHTTVVAEFSAMFPPGTPRVVIEAVGDGAGPTSIVEMPIPTARLARNSSRGDAGHDGYLAALLVAESEHQRAQIGSVRDSHRAAITLTGNELGDSGATLAPFSAIVLATADIAETPIATRHALAQWVRAGGVVIFPGFPRSDALWADLLDRLGLDRPTRTAASLAWQLRDEPLTLPSGRVVPVRWHEAPRGAGMAIHLMLPAVAVEAGISALMTWLDARMQATLSPLDGFFLESGGRLRTGRLFGDTLTTASLAGLRPVGNLGSAVFAWVLVVGVVLVGLRWYAVGPTVAAISIVGTASLFAAIAAAVVPVRAVEVVEVPIVVTRAVSGDLGPSAEMRWVRIQSAKDVGDAGVRIETAPHATMFPAATAEPELMLLRTRLEAPETPTSRRQVGFGEHLSPGSFRLLRVDRLTAEPIPVVVTPFSPLPATAEAPAFRVTVGPEVPVLALMRVRDFQIQPLVSVVESGLEIPAETGFRPYRAVLQEWRSGRLFADLPVTAVDGLTRLTVAVVVETAIRHGQHFLVAVLSLPTSPVISAAGATTVRPTILLIPLPPLPPSANSAGH